MFRVPPSPFRHTKSLITTPTMLGDTVTKELDDWAAKEGFSGRRRDKLGRERCYQNGKPVRCGAGGGSQQQQQPQQQERKPDQSRQQQAPAEQPQQQPQQQERKQPQSGTNPQATQEKIQQYRSYTPNPSSDNDGDGVADAARVGVPAKDVPPPPKTMPTLPNLDERGKQAEQRFANIFLKDPDGVARKFRDLLKERKVGDAPNIFGTDDAKVLSPDYNPQGVSPDESKDAKGFTNLAVHQTANAIAKRAFLQHLDEVVANLPDDKKVVLVTSGGVAAGKGYALKNIPETSNLVDSVGAVWDAAGEQNATENPWILEECKKRGIKAVFAYVHADPVNTWENPDRGVIERAGKVGRMVDARPFADSYAYGARNFQAFMDKNKDDTDATFFVINNATGGKPQREDTVPQSALQIDPEQLYSRCINVVRERASQLKPAVLHGATIGEKVWGPPETGKGYTYRIYVKGTHPMKAKNPALQKLTESIAEKMSQNMVYNDKRRDEVDEADFNRSMQVEPLKDDTQDTPE